MAENSQPSGPLSSDQPLSLARPSSTCRSGLSTGAAGAATAACCRVRGCAAAGTAEGVAAASARTALPTGRVVGCRADAAELRGTGACCGDDASRCPCDFPSPAGRGRGCERRLVAGCCPARAWAACPVALPRWAVGLAARPVALPPWPRTVAARARTAWALCGLPWVLAGPRAVMWCCAPLPLFVETVPAVARGAAASSSAAVATMSATAVARRRTATLTAASPTERTTHCSCKE